MLAINIANLERQTGAAVESFRNEAVKGNNDICAVILAEKANNYIPPTRHVLEIRGNTSDARLNGHQQQQGGRPSPLLTHSDDPRDGRTEGD